MAARDTEVRYTGPIDEVEVLMPADSGDGPRHARVKTGETMKTTAAQAAALVEQDIWELAKPKPEKGGDSK